MTRARRNKQKPWLLHDIVRKMIRHQISLVLLFGIVGHVGFLRLYNNHTTNTANEIIIDNNNINNDKNVMGIYVPSMIDTTQSIQAFKEDESLPLELRSKFDKLTALDGQPSITPLMTVSDDEFTTFQANNLNQLLSSKRPIPIFVYLLHQTSGGKNYLIDELKHFITDGIQQSPYLKLVTNETHREPNLVWIAQVKLGRPPSRWCKHFGAFVRAAWKHNGFHQTEVPIILMDWGDGPDWFNCSKLVRVSPGVTFYTKRSVVANRSYDQKADTVQNGQLQSFTDWRDHGGAPLRHTPYAVRSDFVEGLRQTLVNRSLLQPSHKLEYFDLPGIQRPMDVAHFWPSDGRGVDRGGRVPNSLLRFTVTHTLMTKMKDLKVHTSLAGIADTTGRNSVDLAYPAKMLEFKIVVVAQKDRHEEHYRLMEAIVSGALVLSDVMLSIPKDFVDGESIVFYRNMDELQEKIRYYLRHDEDRIRIARKAYEIALRRHRSWHLMEELILGKPVSPAVLPNAI